MAQGFSFLPVWIGLRYHRSHNKQRFLSLLSWVSLLGMMLGIASLIVVLSVMNGFQQELKGRMLSVMAHGLIETRDNEPINHWQEKQVLIEQIPDIEGVAPWVGGDAMLSLNPRITAIHLNGIDLNYELAINDLSSQLIAGNVGSFYEKPFSMILGVGVARSLGVDVGDKVTLTIPKVLVTPLGLKPRLKQFEVTGIFEAGADVDTMDVFIRLDSAQKLYGYFYENRIDAFRFRTHDVFEVDNIVQRMSDMPLFNQENLTVIPWTKLRTQLFSAIKMEKVMVTLMLTLVIAVAAFNLISMMTMMVAEKRSEIAVLRMMGMPTLSVLFIFLTQGMSLTLVSILIGGFLGVVIALNVGVIVNFFENFFGVYLFDPSVFYISGLPSQLMLSDVLYVIILTFSLSFLFIFYPAYRATRVKAVEALQYQ